MLAQHEQQTGNQVVVATIKSLQGTSIEDYGYQLGRAWGIGQKGTNNGALLLVAPNERQVRIEVGYGLEGQLTDAQSKLIIENLILPEFRKGDFNAGVLAGTTTLLRVLGGDVSAVPRQADDGNSDKLLEALLILALLGIFIWLRLSTRGLGGPGRNYGGVGFFYGGGISGGGMPSGGGFLGGGGSFGGGGASGHW
jgi:uncharacterized protein